MTLKISRKELRKRLKILLLALGGLFLIPDISSFIQSRIPENIPLWIVGLIIILGTLFFFKVE